MAMFALAKFPKWRKMIQAEMKSKLDLTEVPTFEDINKLDCLTAFLKEVLRMFPPSPGSGSRVAKMDHDIGNIKVREGTVVVNNYLGNHFLSTYFKKPNEFNPDRFLNPTQWGDGRLSEEHAYLPFNAEPRVCIAEHFAML